MRTLILGFVLIASISPAVGAPETHDLETTLAQGDPLVDRERATRGYVGSAVCGACHPDEFARWQTSHHDRAMAEASEATVLGDFSGVTFEAHGITSRFFQRDGQFYVHTDGPDGVLSEYPIRYTFGYYPLQQYLIAFPGGRLQPLGIAWDHRPASAGGQRWFHLYPEADPEGPMDHRSPLHWTSSLQTWNHQCADCHSTDLQRRFDADNNRYETRYAEINVGCEACHGPGVKHVTWAHEEATRQAENDPGDEMAVPAAPRPARDGGEAAARGLQLDLKDRDGGIWGIDPMTGRPARSVARTRVEGTERQIEVCAPCHSRRGRIWDDLTPGAPMDQAFRLSLLEPDLYFADGQIKDEVFVYGSFIQSRMYHQGVVCQDCHDPHSLQLQETGNGVCTRCHVAARYDTPEHHHHEIGTAGTACIDCHMPQRVYMVVDERADHSMRVPRPDLSVALGTPNACNDCHQDRDAVWAATHVATWYPDPVHRGPHFAETFHAAASDASDAGERLATLVADLTQPAIVRATALAQLRTRGDQQALDAAQGALTDAHAIVRAQAVRALDLGSLQTRVDLAWPLLSDSSRLVRLEAARVLAPAMRERLDPVARDHLTRAVNEYSKSESVNADRPEAHLNLGLLAFDLGESSAAEQAYRTALNLDGRFTPARINLADLYRALGREKDSRRELQAGLAEDPGSADLHFALGLAQVRAQQLEQALASLATATELVPEQTRFAYVYAVALDSAERTREAIAVLEHTHQHNQVDPDILAALVQFNARLGDADTAARWLARLRELDPKDAAIPVLETQLRDAQRGG
ncbi:hypothetical protein CKO25_14385 [Thiocapsa imhoffii]|uniref:Cytochrome c-552/4 domain-containing protein n=2 Tax=Thiocapsa imhoffii TaxID=382777 RepID=A0A9X0WJV2_9GAMM|nr:hypothetical protein [Thiocapsa imhoffii]